MVLRFGLVTVMDQTIVNVALPAIGTALHFSQSSLSWVVNAYLIGFGGLLLLVGRVGDLVGRRRRSRRTRPLTCGISTRSHRMAAALGLHRACLGNCPTQEIAFLCDAVFGPRCARIFQRAKGPGTERDNRSCSRLCARSARCVRFLLALPGAPRPHVRDAAMGNWRRADMEQVRSRPTCAGVTCRRNQPSDREVALAVVLDQAKFMILGIGHHQDRPFVVVVSFASEASAQGNNEVDGSVDVIDGDV